MRRASRGRFERPASVAEVAWCAGRAGLDPPLSRVCEVCVAGGDRLWFACELFGCSGWESIHHLQAHRQQKVMPSWKCSQSVELAARDMLSAVGCLAVMLSQGGHAHQRKVRRSSLKKVSARYESFAQG